MKGLKFALALETAGMCQPDVLLGVAVGCWGRTTLRFLALQVARHFSHSQAETLDSLHSTGCSEETAKYDHLRAFRKVPVTAEAEMVSSSTRGSIQPTSHVKMITKYFSVSASTAYRIMEKESRLKSCNVHSLARNMNTFQENGVDPADVRKYMVLLCRCPLTMEHNIAALKELGLSNLKTVHLTQIITLFQARAALIKRWGLLPEHYDPLETLASLGVPEQVTNNVKFCDSSDNLTLAQLHWELSSVYLSWRLDCSRERVSKLQQTYKLTKKSMKLQQKVLDQLKCEWNIHLSKILKNGYLLTCSPVNIALIDSKVKQIAGISVREYASMIPRILTIPYHQLLQVSSILSKLQITQASVKGVPRICTLHPDTLQERINRLQQIPEFLALKSHPRMLHLIYYHNKMIRRLDLLQEVKKHTALPSLNRLSGTKKRFNKYMRVGDLRQNKRDIIICLSRHMNVEPSVIRKCLHDQCWGSQTTVVNVQRNLAILREAGFSEDQLMAGLDVVLYPPDLLQDQLIQLQQKPKVQPFSIFKSNTHVLQLLLYFMEKSASLTSFI